MEAIVRNVEVPTPWYWNQPENGISLEDCEDLFLDIIKAFRKEERNRKIHLEPTPVNK